MSKVPVKAHEALVKETLKSVDISPGNIDTCRRFCGTCPTYLENKLGSGDPSILFCGQGGSGKKESIKKFTCKCPVCGVHKRYELTGEYYCTQ